MDEKGFRAFVAAGKRVKPDLDEAEIRSNLEVVAEFERFLSRSGSEKAFRSASKDEVEAFVEELGRSGKADYENLVALVRYARFANSKVVEARVIEMLDGAEVMDALAEILKNRIGQDRCDSIFLGIELPSLQTPHANWPIVTKQVMERLEAQLDEGTWKDVLLAGPHTAPDEYYLPERKKFEESKGIDEYLSGRADEFAALLKQCVDEDRLFFNQEIDEDVLAFVRANKEIGGGVRDGDTIFETKIPYLAREYLRETDSVKKRYFYCHCPWVRDAIRSGIDVSPNFCYCSAAYHKKPWDVIFREPVEAEVVSSVLRGDLVCRFAIKIPEEYREKARS